MTRGDLRATTPEAQRLEPSGERELGLRRVPTAGKLRGHRAPAVHLHPETVEAERLRPFDRRVVAAAVAEPVARFACLARGAHPPRFTGLACLPRPTRSIKRQLHRLSPSLEARLRRPYDRLGPDGTGKGSGSRRQGTGTSGRNRRVVPGP